MKVKTVLLILVGILTVFSQVAYGEDLDKASIVDPANRWAFIIDASTVNTESYASFKSELLAAGFPTDHIFVFSSSAKDQTLRSSRENIAKILDGIKNPERNLIPQMAGTEKRRLRTKNGPCEVQLYVTAGGVANKDQTRNMIVPSGIKVDEITRTDDNRLISLNEIEDALTSPGEDQLPIERTLLVVNFLSVHTVTRSVQGKAVDNPFEGINISKVPVRSAQNTKEEDSGKFLHVRILTKNGQITDQTAESFYQTLEKGIHGFADISGNQDNIVQADELVNYIKSNMRSDSVEEARNGNDPFPISKTKLKAEIPDGLFNTIGQNFTQEKYAPERERAYKFAREQEKGTEQ